MGVNATRRSAREWAIQMLTAADLNPPEDLNVLIADFWQQIADLSADEGGSDSVRGKLRDFAEERVRGVMEHRDELDGILVGVLDHWDLYRLGTVERAVLRMGLWELRYSDVPKPVVINESIDLSNWFSTPKSRMLVNAVLDKCAKTLTA